jgi:hypothetical protein
MTDKLEQISALLHEASETHHRVFRIVDGADDDWASWYAFRMSPALESGARDEPHPFVRENQFFYSERRAAPRSQAAEHRQ